MNEATTTLTRAGFIYGIQKRDKTIYLACIGWIALDAAIIIGVMVHR